MRAKGRWFTLHRWLGLVLGLWFALVGLTGLYLAMPYMLRVLISFGNEQPRTVAAAPADSIYFGEQLSKEEAKVAALAAKKKNPTAAKPKKILPPPTAKST